ncbi:MAG: DUF4493 domain-containing protein [Bacteroidales bacterium]|nr:DUF4493 domain-containing protein [Bacteroidales bacterium]
MKTNLSRLALVALPIFLFSCQDNNPSGTLKVSLPELFPPSTRAEAGVPDIGTFLITVTSDDGQVAAEDVYARFPEELSLPAGTYSVSASSCDFVDPAFERPCWGDTQIAAVPAEGSVSVVLDCHQLNSGLRIEVEDSFRSVFPTGRLRLRGPGGALPYAYGETRTAFFLPGAVSLSLDGSGPGQTLFTRQLEAGQILSIQLCANANTRNGGIGIQLDTTRQWIKERFIAGDSDPHGIDGAYPVQEARQHAGENGVWVQGYIIGVATNTRKISLTPPFTKNTNLVLGPRATTNDPEHCLSVALPSGAIRSELNLQEHPELLGRHIYLRGDLVSAYYGIPGLKAPSEYQFD